MSQSDDPTTENETYGDYSVDDEDQPVGEDNLVTGPGSDVADEMDRGYSPPEKWSAGQGYGNTPYEEATGESFDQRLAQEEPDPTVEELERLESGNDDATAEAVDGGTEVEDAEAGPEVGDVRAGRLVDPDQGLGEDTEASLVGDDVGIDGAAASAEEAAMHVIPDDET